MLVLLILAEFRDFPELPNKQAVWRSKLAQFSEQEASIPLPAQRPPPPVNSATPPLEFIRDRSVMTLQEQTDFKTGDLVACFGADLTSRVISTMTGCFWAPAGLRWGPSHVAIIGEREQQPIWVESTTLCPHACLIREEPVAGPQAHPPALRMADYLEAGGRIEIYRPTPLNRYTGFESALLSRLLLEECVAANLPYDLTGALLSGSRYLQRTRWFPTADLSALFCSELVAAVLMRMGRLNRHNPARFHPGRLLRTLVQEGTYARLAS